MMKGYPFTNQNGKKRQQSKEWSEIRAEMMTLKKQLNLADDEFRPLSPYENYDGIQEKVYQTFCNIEKGSERPTWLWHCFKQTEYFVDYFHLPEPPECYLHELINPNETIWCGVIPDLYDSKMWLYEGNILAIQKVIAVALFDEVYFISKKYKWLFCLNHSGTLIATGGDMPNKLKALHEKLA